MKLPIKLQDGRKALILKGGILCASKKWYYLLELANGFLGTGKTLFVDTSLISQLIFLLKIGRIQKQ